jgi:hypothetical protein
MMEKLHTKHETSERKDNDHRGKGKKREKESQHKKTDRTTWGRIKARKGWMGCRTKRANWRWQSSHKGRYETTADALNPHLWCINLTRKEASSTSFMEHPYSTRAQKQLVYSQKKHKEREIVAQTHKARS